MVWPLFSDYEKERNITVWFNNLSAMIYAIFPRNTLRVLLTPWTLLLRPDRGTNCEVL